MRSPVFGSSRPTEQARQNELAETGPQINVHIRALNSPLAGVAARGLIDTGATSVCIDSRLAEKAGLRFVDETANVIVVGGAKLQASIFAGRLIVPELDFDEPTRFCAIQMSQESRTILLGRSFLRHFIVTYDGPQGRFHFHRPGQIAAENDALFG